MQGRLQYELAEFAVICARAPKPILTRQLFISGVNDDDASFLPP